MVRRALTSKLGFRRGSVAASPTFERVHEGQVVGVTHISQAPGRRDVSDCVVGRMARELGVTGPESRDAIDCSISREEFFGLLVEG